MSAAPGCVWSQRRRANTEIAGRLEAYASARPIRGYSVR
jgi:hypothetical protein